MADTRVTDWESFQSLAALPTHHLIQWDKHRAYRRLLHDYAPPSPISMIELGCGSGRIAAYLASRTPTQSITLVDRSVAMLHLARSTMERAFSPASSVHPSITYIHKDFFSLSLHETFDIVMSQGVLEHFPFTQREELLALHRNLCAPQGMILIAVPTPTPVYRTARGFLERTGLWWFPDERPFTMEKLQQETQHAGLIIERATTFWNLYLTEILLLCRPR